MPCPLCHLYSVICTLYSINHAFSHRMSTRESSYRVVAKIYCSPPSFILYCVRSSLTVRGKLRVVMLAFESDLKRAFALFLSNGTTSFTSNLRPGNSLLSSADV